MSFPLKWVSRSIIVIFVLGAFLVMLFDVERHPDSQLCLNIYLFKDNKETLLYSKPVQDEQEIILSYIHSSDLTPVKQVFLISKNESLDLREEKYRWYGAGLEFGSDHDIRYDEGWVIVSGYDRSFKSLPIRVATTVEQTLMAGAETILLSDLAPAGSTVLLKVEIYQ